MVMLMMAKAFVVVPAFVTCRLSGHPALRDADHDEAPHEVHTYLTYRVYLAYASNPLHVRVQVFHSRPKLSHKVGL